MEQIILGIDAASTSTGVSILCGDNLIYNKLIQPPKNVKKPNGKNILYSKRIRDIV